jgi:hypothetical protein
MSHLTDQKPQCNVLDGAFQLQSTKKLIDYRLFIQNYRLVFLGDPVSLSLIQLQEEDCSQSCYVKDFRVLGKRFIRVFFNLQIPWVNDSLWTKADQ